MPQPKSSTSTTKSTARTPAAKAKPRAAAKPKAKPAAKPKARAAAKATPAAKPKARAAAKPAAARTAPRAKPKAAAKPKAKAATKPRAAAKPKATPDVAPLPGTEQLPESLAAVLETLHRGVVLQRERLQEVVDDAVSRGRMTRADAEDLVQSLVVSGRRGAEDIIAEVEKVLNRGVREVETATRQARRRTAASPVTREVDRARRRIGVGGFPILGFDELTAAQVVDRLADLTPAQLRKVRDHERRNANRKGVLNGIEKRLG